MKTERELTELLDKLISRWEDEVVEFKQGGAGYSTHDIGKSFSALSNEANLREHIVVGTENSPDQHGCRSRHGGKTATEQTDEKCCVRG